MSRRKAILETVFHVSLAGSDAWNGGLPVPAADGSDGPFATLARAAVAVQQARAQQPDRRVRVLVRGGLYLLDETLCLSPAHSGTGTAPVVFAAAPGEAPVISGGRRITSWQAGVLNGQPCWTADLPDVRRGTWQFTQLFVDGVRRPRTRLPRTGYHHFAGLPEGMVTPATGWLQGPDRALFKPGDMQAWRNLDDIKVVALQLWFETHHRIRALDMAVNTVYFRAKSLGSLRDERGEMARYYVENVMEAACEPGDWYLDRSAGQLHYLPRPGEDMAVTDVIAPRLERIVSFAGSEQAPVAHVRLENFALQHAEWDYPAEDPGSIQAAFKVPGAVVFDHAEHCVLYGCSISKVAHYGIEVKAGSHGNQIVACAISDMGAGGVRINHERLERVNETCVVSEPGRSDSKPMETTVSDCEIHDGSSLHLSAIGIWLGNCSRNRILHNHIFNMNYTGISCGWTWGYAPTATVDNRIEYNHIHHINHTRILSDNGGIYTLGIQPGTTLRGNHIHDIACYGYGGWGIYPDEGSSEMRIEDNVVHHTLYAGFSTHYGRDNVVRNNIFALAAEAHVGAGRREGHRTTLFEQNIVYWNAGKWLGQDLVPGCFTFRRNLLWDTRGGTLDLGSGATVADWQGLGQHAESAVADPLFADPAAGNFALREDSPALPLGFKPVDPSLAGPRCRDTRPLSFDDWPAGPVGEKEILRTYLSFPTPDALAVTVENVGTLPASGSLKFKASPGPQVKLPRGAEFAFRNLAPGAQTSQAFPVQVAPGVGTYFIETVPTGEGLVPALVLTRHTPVWRMPRLTARPEVSQIGAALASAPVMTVRRVLAPVAELRAGFGGDAWVFHARVTDRQVEVVEPAWMASCVEVFCAPAVAAQEGMKPAVVQLFLVPAMPGGSPAHALRQDHDRPVPVPEIDIKCTPTPEGYDLQVAVPLALLKLPADTREFRLEIAVTARRRVGGSFSRAALYDASAAYASPDGYGPGTVCP